MAELNLEPPAKIDLHPGPWYREMTAHCWFVLIVAAMAWLFDCLDQHLFNQARRPAMEELLSGTGANATAYGYYVTGIFLLGWGTGGIFFGALGDKIGRAKTLIVCILLYSVCTGLIFFSHAFWDFAVFQLMTGLGIGGVFAVGVALVAETVPSSARAGALGLLQALSTVGNALAAVIGYAFGLLAVPHAWRWMFVVGALPAAMVVLVQRKVHEPELWLKAKAEGKLAGSLLGSLGKLFSDPRWRKNAIIGLVLGCAGIVGFWGVGVFSNDLVRTVLKDSLASKHLEPADLDSQLTTWVAINLFMMQIGGFTGMMLYARLARVLGRKPTFAIAFVLAFLATVLEFQGMTSHYQVFWLTPIMGFCQLGIFALYAIYFPELFPTSLRATGTSFCYNFGRFVAAAGAFIQGYYALSQASSKPVDTLRSIGTWTALVYLVGILALPFAPETKGKLLPE
ncbi:MAG TPA: MFS transporter [Pirellulales bacterium]|jgi:MFS family permease|nr:MFS transporter [Pirellulales bacterium]